MKKADNKGKEMKQKTVRSKVRITLALGAVLLCSTLAIGARAWLGAPVETVAVVINAEGFTPSEVTCAAGSFTLSVTNQSRAEGLTLRLARDSGELVQEITVGAQGQQASTEVSLPAGGYTLTEANHPAWLFHITAQ
jgi:hypothetical protein